MAELDRAAISLRIAEARDKRAGLTQPELAEILQVHWRTVQDWESPKNATVPWDRLGEIAEVAGITKEWLLHGEESARSNGSSALGSDDEAATRHAEVIGRLDAIEEQLRLIAVATAAEVR